MEARVIRWIWVSLPYATFAVVVQGGRVVDAAPIARWTLGKSERFVADYYRGKGAEFARLPSEDHQIPGAGLRAGQPQRG